MVPASSDSQTLAVRRSAAAIGLSAGLFGVLLMLDRLSTSGPATGVDRVVRDGWGNTLLVAAAGLLPVVLAPVAVRMLARPRTSTLPPQAEATAVAGVAAALCCLAAGLNVLAFGRLTGESVHLDRTAVTQSLFVVLSAAIAGTAGIAAAYLYRARPAAGKGGASQRRHPARPRPDLFDDLTTLAARVLPGSPVARGLAWINRGLDRWGWSPRPRQRRRPAARTSPTRVTYGREAVPR